MGLTGKNQLRNRAAVAEFAQCQRLNMYQTPFDLHAESDPHRNVKGITGSSGSMKNFI